MNINNLIDSIITGLIQVRSQASIYKKSFEIIEETSKLNIEKMITLKNFLRSCENSQKSEPSDNNIDHLLRKKRKIEENMNSQELREEGKRNTTPHIQWVEFDKNGRKKKNKSIILNHTIKCHWAFTDVNKNHTLYYCKYRKRGCKYAVHFEGSKYLIDEGEHSHHPQKLPSIQEDESDDMDISDDY